MFLHGPDNCVCSVMLTQCFSAVRWPWLRSGVNRTPEQWNVPRDSPSRLRSHSGLIIQRLPENQRMWDTLALLCGTRAQVSGKLGKGSKVSEHLSLCLSTKRPPSATSAPQTLDPQAAVGTNSPCTPTSSDQTNNTQCINATFD